MEGWRSGCMGKKLKNNVCETDISVEVGKEMAERIYLDTNVYCRPLDDQRDFRINAETEAFLAYCRLC